jgi:predicted GNAT family acetyltransferase
MHRLRIYQLERLIAVPPVSGRLEPATKSDIEFLTNWNIAFVKDVKQPLTGNERVMVERAVAETRLFIWKDPGPVSMAAWAGPTPSGVRINMVYTPPEFRGRGYASNAVATLTRDLLNSGRKFVFLYTDLDNPTSNKIYRQMGYEPVIEISEVDFEKKK